MRDDGLERSAVLSEPVTVVERAMAVPDGRKRRATVVDACGAPVVDAGTFRHDSFVAAEFVDRDKEPPVEKLAGTWLFGGMFWLHFGHFLFETISRLWAVPGLRGQIDGIVFFRSHAHREPPRLFSTILQRLDIDLPIRFIDSPTEFERLVVPRQGCGMGALSAGTPAFRAFVRDRLQTIAPRVGAERIYLTREGYRLQRGGIFAESHLRGLLEAEGYTAFSPEQHAFDVQVATYLGARHIVGPDSSALHLVGFAAPPEAEVAILLRRHGGERDVLPQLAGFMGRRPLVVDSIARLYRRDNERNPNWSLFAELDLPMLGAALQDGGFIEGVARWRPLRGATRQALLVKYEKVLGAPFSMIWQRRQKAAGAEQGRAGAEGGT